MKSFFLRLLTLERRYPWALPLGSFLGGWLGFAMVQRGEGLARIVALLALLGWVWLLIEPWIRRSIERRRPRAGNLVVNFVTQSLQQELLFFSLPFLIGATQWDVGQLAFTGLVGIGGAAEHDRSRVRARDCETRRAPHVVSRVLQLDRRARRLADGDVDAAGAGTADLVDRRNRLAAADAADVVAVAAATP